MSVMRRRKADGSAASDEDDYLLVHGNLPVGRICKRQSAFRADAKWLWTLNGIIGGPETLRLAGTAGSSESAEAELKANWQHWLKWANLSETKPNG
jgi:hypothetical protein